MKLIPFDPQYAELFYSWRDDPVAIKYNPLLPSTVESLREMLSSQESDLARYDVADSFRWLLSLNGQIVGNVSLKNMNRMMLFAEIGYSIAPEHRNKGLATQGIGLLVDQAFQKTPLRKLVAYVHEDNVASRRALEKQGFKCEGVLRDHYLIQGKPANEAIYGLLKSEYQK